MKNYIKEGERTSFDTSSKSADQRVIQRVRDDRQICLAGIAATAVNEGSIRAGSTVFTQRRPRLIFQWSAPLKRSTRAQKFRKHLPSPPLSFTSPSSFDQAAAYLRPSSRTRTNTDTDASTNRTARGVCCGPMKITLHGEFESSLSIRIWHYGGKGLSHSSANLTKIVVIEQTYGQVLRGKGKRGKWLKGEESEGR